MRRILWLSSVVLGVVGVVGGIGNAGAISVPTQQMDGNGVTVTATLLKDQPEDTAIKLTLDSYFVNLVRCDFRDLATLRDDTGRTYPVTSVEQIGSNLKPRFRQAILRFPKVAPEAKTIELIVTEVAGVKERVFRWSAVE